MEDGTGVSGRSDAREDGSPPAGEMRARGPVDVLLTHSYCLRLDRKQTEKMRPYPPLALLYAASLLRSAGHTVALFDSTFADPFDDFAASLRRFKPRYVVLFEDSFNFVIKMCLGRMRQTALEMADVAVKRAATVIAAGPDVTDNPEAYLARGVSYALIGEAELALRELIDVLSGRSCRTVEEIEGVCTAGAGDLGARRTRLRTPERTPDRFPFPAWDLIDVEAYRSAWVLAHGYFSLNMVASRGCPFRCNWCAKPIWGQQYALRSPANVAEEMALVKHTLAPDHVWFTDDIFGLRPGWVEEFAREVSARRASIPFMIQTRVDRMSESAVAALRTAGCVEVWMGAESGSQRVLDAMEKAMDVAQVPEACARLKAAGIRACLFLQFGYPGESLEDVLATVGMVRKCLPDQIGVSVSYPLPGTRFYERVRISIGAQSHWTESGDLSMMFSGTYGSPFYRTLHAVIHKDLAVRQKIAKGDTDGLLPELDAVSSAWMELGQLEVTQRNANPTQLAVVCERSQPMALNGGVEQ